MFKTCIDHPDITRIERTGELTSYFDNKLDENVTEISQDEFAEIVAKRKGL